MGRGFESLLAYHKFRIDCIIFDLKDYMVRIAQLAEHRIVDPGVAGSSPVSHPIF